MPIETNAVTPKKIAIVTGGSRGIGRNTVAVNVVAPGLGKQISVAGSSAITLP